jgi:hypothetical protein
MKVKADSTIIRVKGGIGALSPPKAFEAKDAEDFKDTVSSEP